MSDSQVNAAWRVMRDADLDRVMKIAAEVHPGFPERRAVMAERLALYPAGCLVLERAGEGIGYFITHPWHAGEGVKLDTLLGALPDRPGSYYLHDLALLPQARGTGAAKAGVAHVAGHAREAGFADLSLVAVNGSVPFWTAQGFAVARGPDLGTYGGDAAFMVRRL